MAYCSNWYVSWSISAASSCIKLLCFALLVSVQHDLSIDPTETQNAVLQLVEESPAEVKESSAEELLGCIQKLQSLKNQHKDPAGRI